MGSISQSINRKGPILEWSSAGSPLKGPDSGDLEVIATFSDGALVAVMDGLGHGPEAAAAVRDAAKILQSRPEESVLTLIQLCHEALRYTRGAVMSLASFSTKDSSMTWTGVGNVDGMLLHVNPAANPSRDILTPRGGVVGYQLPALRAVTVSVSADDTLVMATDGIRSGFATGLSLHRSVEETAHFILSTHGKGTDDALVVVARYLGGTKAETHGRDA